MSEKPRQRTGVVYSDRFKDHLTGEGHPESPARMDAVARALGARSLDDRLHPLGPRLAGREEVLLVHTERLYEEILATKEQERTYLDEDTVTSPDSAEVALLAVGGALVAIQEVLAGNVANAFAFLRPPGHHAKPDKAMGFCLFNNVAIAAQYALRPLGVGKILIVDFDLHHGNGTQKAFYMSPEVLYVSTHQWPYYPGTGGLEEIGKDEGEGFTVNIPLPVGTGDAEYVRVFREVIGPVGREFHPDLVLVSAGFDAHARDPLGGMQVTASGFAAISREILLIAEETCQGRAVFLLEGGYHLLSLEQSIVSVLEVLGGLETETETWPEGRSVDPIVESLRRVHQGRWPSLRR